MDILFKIILVFLFLAVCGKWFLILLVFPFQVLEGRYRRNKTLVNRILAAPYVLWERLFRGGWQRYMFYQVAFIPSHHLRRMVYKMLGMRMGARNVFHFGTEIRDITNIKMGNGNIIGDRAILDGRRGLVLGNNVCLSSDVTIWTLQHDHRSPDFSCAPSGGQVTIEDRVWVGSHVTILPGVTIGEGAVCCAGCVVTKDVEPFSVVAGIPAHKVNERPHDIRYEFDGRACRLY